MLDLPSPYNAIIGRHTQTEFHVSYNMWSLSLVFGTNSADTYIYVNQNDALVNYVASPNGPTEASTSTDPKRKRLVEPEPTTPKDSLPDLSGDFEEVETAPGKKFRIGKDLPTLDKNAVIHLLQANLDVFT